VTEPITVLLVEDDQHLAQLVSTYFESCGVRVATQDAATDVIAEAVRHVYDCVVLNVAVPTREVECCRGLREASDVAIVMVSAFGDEAIRIRCLEAGADDVVTKPVSARELLARVKANVRRARGHAGPSLRG
jgi:DNA-binding response OmpR family regulator